MMKPRLVSTSVSQSYNPKTTAARSVCAASNPTKSKPTAASKLSKPSWDFDAVDDFPKQQSQCTVFLAKKKAEAAKRDREEKRKSILLDEIPTFLV